MQDTIPGMRMFLFKLEFLCVFFLPNFANFIYFQPVLKKFGNFQPVFFTKIHSHACYYTVAIRYSPHNSCHKLPHYSSPLMSPIYHLDNPGLYMELAYSILIMSKV